MKGDINDLPPGCVIGKSAAEVMRGEAGTEPKQRKYRNVPTTVNGINFASKKEAKRYGELKAMERAAKIIGLELQPVFPLLVNGIVVGKYIGDFRYQRCVEIGLGIELETVVEDCKGGNATKTPVYRLKKKMVKAQYGIDIQEI